VGQVSNVGCESEYRPMVANNKYKLEEKYKKEYCYDLKTLVLVNEKNLV